MYICISKIILPNSPISDVWRHSTLELFTQLICIQFFRIPKKSSCVNARGIPPPPPPVASTHQNITDSCKFLTGKKLSCFSVSLALLLSLTVRVPPSGSDWKGGYWPRQGVPPVSWMGVPPCRPDGGPPCEQTDTCENSIFPIPSESGR